MVLDITDTEGSTLHLINIYHAVPQHGHDLHYLISHTLDETVPMLLMGDLNTHDLHWS